MIDFPSARNKFSFYLDRKGKRVTIDINSNAKIFSKHLDVPMLNETTTIRSFAISFSQNVLNLYIDCNDVFKDEMEFNLSQLFLDMDEPLVKLFRERKYPLFLDGSIEAALDRASCSKGKPNRKYVKDNEKKKYNDGEFRIHEKFSGLLHTQASRKALKEKSTGLLEFPHRFWTMRWNVE